MAIKWFVIEEFGEDFSSMSSNDLCESIDRISRLRAGVEKSQDIYGVAVDESDRSSIHSAARQVKRMILDDERAIIDSVLTPQWYTWDQVSRDVWDGDLWWYDDGELIYPVNLGWAHEDGKSTPFATQGQWGWGRSRTLQEMGGRWRPCMEPEADKAYRAGGC
jgi:hypothetical protein